MNDDERAQISNELDRSSKAKRIYEDELFQEAFQMLEKEIIQSWKSAPLRDKDGHHELKLMFQIVHRVKDHFISVMETGKMAQEQLNTWEKMKRSVQSIYL